MCCSLWPTSLNSSSVLVRLCHKVQSERKEVDVKRKAKDSGDKNKPLGLRRESIANDPLSLFSMTFVFSLRVDRLSNLHFVSRKGY